MSEEQRYPDGPLTPEQESIVASLSADFVRQVDAALLSHARVAWRKVAMLVGSAMMDSTLRVPGLPDTFYSMRVRKLVGQACLRLRAILATCALVRSGFQAEQTVKHNPALNPVRFALWTLRDEAAQRRLALR